VSVGMMAMMKSELDKNSDEETFIPLLAVTVHR